MKLLLVDIETAPNLAATWGLWDQNIALDQLLKPGYTLCWAAKWYGESEIMFSSMVTGKRQMIRQIHRLLNDAEAVCHYNGKKFDIPTLNKEFLLMELAPPSPAKQVDLLEVAKRKFRLASNKLDFVAGQLGLGNKTKHKGMSMWLRCMDGDKAAWKLMERYNRQDVVLLEKVYKRLLPWIDNHPNLSVMQDIECCVKCESTSFQARGYSMSAAGRYSRFQCNDCGAWFRGVRRERAVNKTFREAR